MIDLSDTPAGMIARLDDRIAKRGQSVTLRRVAPSVPDIDHPARAHVAGYEPQELTAGITMGSSKVILSPTSLVGSAFATVWPKPGDKIVISNRVRNIGAADPRVINDVLVRINLTVTG